VTPLLATVNAAAAYRLTRLVQEDSLPPLPALRNALLQRASESERDALIYELVTCPWCLGFWVSVGVIAADTLVPKVWRPLALALAMSAAVGHLRKLDN
jgi:hypothetical protein